MGELSGVVIVDADRMAQAVARVEQLGCTVANARPMKLGRFAVDVQMSLRAANAVAFAVARRELTFERQETLGRLAS